MNRILKTGLAAAGVAAVLGLGALALRGGDSVMAKTEAATAAPRPALTVTTT